MYSSNKELQANCQHYNLISFENWKLYKIDGFANWHPYDTAWFCDRQPYSNVGFVIWQFYSIVQYVNDQLPMLLLLLIIKTSLFTHFYNKNGKNIY